MILFLAYTMAFYLWSIGIVVYWIIVIISQVCSDVIWQFGQLRPWNKQGGNVVQIFKNMMLFCGFMEILMTRRSSSPDFITEHALYHLCMSIPPRCQGLIDFNEASQQLKRKM